MEGLLRIKERLVEFYVGPVH